MANDLAHQRGHRQGGAKNFLSKKKTPGNLYCWKKVISKVGGGEQNMEKKEERGGARYCPRAGGKKKGVATVRV